MSLGTDSQMHMSGNRHVGGTRFRILKGKGGMVSREKMSCPKLTECKRMIFPSHFLMDLPVSPDGSVIYVADDKGKLYCI